MSITYDELLGALRGIDLQDARRRLDKVLRPAPRRLRPPAQVLLPGNDGTSVVDELLAHARPAARDALLHQLGYEGILDHALEGRWRYEVACANPSSEDPRAWGFGSFVLGSRGYFIELPSPVDEGDHRCRLLGAWEPAEAEAAREAAWLDVYGVWWERIGLPPCRVEIADGPRPLIMRALGRILGEDDAAWAEAIHRSLRPDRQLDDLIRCAWNVTGLPLPLVEAVLRGTRSPGVREVPAVLRRRILREAYGQAWRCVTTERPLAAAQASNQLVRLINERAIPLRKQAAWAGYGIRVTDVTPDEIAVEHSCRSRLDRKDEHASGLCDTFTRSVAGLVQFRWRRCRFTDWHDRKRVLDETRTPCPPAFRTYRHDLFGPGILGAWQRLLEAWPPGAGARDDAGGASQQMRGS